MPKTTAGEQSAIYARDTLAIANAGPGTNGRQFFTVYGDTELPPDYTAFGKITNGMDTLDSVARAGTDNTNGEGDGAPKKKITIQDVTIDTRTSRTTR
ncbi:peptidylprolyl isomerase [Streptomyces xanthophaeus]|uniref:peptidylprolyl isomerase n=1 Tax=Streptomyces xanthophaeus TaxID=67385 RepID=UPI00365AEAC1